MRKGWIFICFSLLALPAPLLRAEDASFPVAKVTSGTCFTLGNGETVRLEGIEIPVSGTYAGDAKTKLITLTEHQSVRLVYDEQRRDRYGRITAQAYLPDGTWIQAALLKDGLAMVSAQSHGPNEKTADMLAAEHQAQLAKRGLWADDALRVITPEEAGTFIDRFKVVEGTVTSVNAWHDNIYLNFSDRWKDHFNVFISKKYAERFSFADLQALIGKTVRVRGWIRYHHGPTMDIMLPTQIETQ